MAPSGLVTIVGGKLTTYRAMAEDTVDEAVGVMRTAPVRPRAPAPARVPDSRSGSTPLFGAEGYEELAEPGAAERLGLAADVVAHLAGRFGGHAQAVAAMVRERPELGERLVPGLPYLKAEAVYAVRYEMALTLEDVLSRRTRALLLDVAATAGAAAVRGRADRPRAGLERRGAPPPGRGLPGPGGAPAPGGRPGRGRRRGPAAGPAGPGADA